MVSMFIHGCWLGRIASKPGDKRKNHLAQPNSTALDYHTYLLASCLILPRQPTTHNLACRLFDISRCHSKEAVQESGPIPPTNLSMNWCDLSFESHTPLALLHSLHSSNCLFCRSPSSIPLFLASAGKKASCMTVSTVGHFLPARKWLRTLTIETSCTRNI